MSARHVARIRIAQDHPALPGHFPGEPVVPGVVLLERLLEVAEEELGRPLRVVGLAHVKFPAPLRPDEEARASFESDGARLSFEIERDGRTIARGVFRLSEESAP